MNTKTLWMMATLLTSALVSSSTQARFYVWYDDPFDMPWVDQLIDFHDRTIDRMKAHLDSWGHLKEDREAVKAARESLNKIKHTVTEDDAVVTISFTGFEDLDKKNVKVVKKGNGWFGTVTLKEGTVEFFIAPYSVLVTRRVEFKKEVTTDKKDEKAPAKQERVVYTSSASEVDYFKSLVDISTLKAQPVKPTELTFTISKQKEEVLPLL